LSLARAEITVLLALQNTSLITWGLTIGDAETAMGSRRDSAAEERILKTLYGAEVE